ncbi:MAG: type I restriction enzyme HsdR N-terminal domain-containing protein [Bacteroidales bacterium]|nr:type I restriction enzyme HsdR N-terminal domain-containing protein [Bacteroidales bacterium]
MFPKLNLPEYQIKFKETEKGLSGFDIIRKKYILLTPEEYVRQQFIHYLIEKKQYPKGLLAVEKQLKIYDTTKRTDIVLYDKQGNVSIIVECKAPKVKISQDAFDQIARYNMNFKAKYLIVTNGITHYCCKPNYNDNSYIFLKNIPDYEIIMNN